MLRKKVGDVTFKSILNTYLNDPNLAFDYAVTSDFKRVAAQVSGTSLDEFFNDWIYGEGHPQHVVNWSNTSPSSINVQVSQSQSHASVAFFEVDLPLRLIGASGESMDVIASPTSSGASFNFVTGFPVVEVLIDPDVHTLSRNNSAVLGVNDAFAKAELQIYPNPTVDVVTIKSRLLDLMGYSLHD
jgi:aminopeptidase N